MTSEATSSAVQEKAHLETSPEHVDMEIEVPEAAPPKSAVADDATLAGPPSLVVQATADSVSTMTTMSMSVASPQMTPMQTGSAHTAFQFAPVEPELFMAPLSSVLSRSPPFQTMTPLGLDISLRFFVDNLPLQSPCIYSRSASAAPGGCVAQVVNHTHSAYGMNAYPGCANCGKVPVPLGGRVWKCTDATHPAFCARCICDWVIMNPAFMHASLPSTGTAGRWVSFAMRITSIIVNQNAFIAEARAEDEARAAQATRAAAEKVQVKSAAAKVTVPPKPALPSRAASNADSPAKNDAAPMTLRRSKRKKQVRDAVGNETYNPDAQNAHLMEEDDVIVEFGSPTDQPPTKRRKVCAEKHEREDDDEADEEEETDGQVSDDAEEEQESSAFVESDADDEDEHMADHTAGPSNTNHKANKGTALAQLLATQEVEEQAAKATASAAAAAHEEELARVAAANAEVEEELHHTLTLLVDAAIVFRDNWDFVTEPKQLLIDFDHESLHECQLVLNNVCEIAQLLADLGHTTTDARAAQLLAEPIELSYAVFTKASAVIVARVNGLKKTATADDVKSDEEVETTTTSTPRTHKKSDKGKKSKKKGKKAKKKAAKKAKKAKKAAKKGVPATKKGKVQLLVCAPYAAGCLFHR